MEEKTRINQLINNANFSRYYYLYLFFLLFIVTVGCNIEKETTSVDDEIENNILILDQTLWQEFVIDAPYEYNIQSLNINNDTLLVDISYIGGCKDHEFAFIGSEIFAYSNPPQAWIVISHEPFNDICTDSLFELLKCDISPLQDYLDLPIAIRLKDVNDWLYTLYE